MASDKKRRKVAKAKQQVGNPAAGPPRHPDGDRRRRGGASAKQAIKDKLARREFPWRPAGG